MLEQKILYLAETDFPECYEQCPTGGFQLTSEAKAEIERQEKELAEMRKDWTEQLAAKDNQIADMDATIEKLIKHRAIDSALRKAGADRNLMKAAQALLEQNLHIVIEERDGEHVLSVITPYGEATIGQAIGQWLQSDEGAAYAPKMAARDGPFADAIGRIKNGQLH